ncbi:MAG: PAS domain S-box protein, partial [Polynucleobacter sp.]|nr:PAS domain S-box protein [Polynucleobacter sp.]
MDAVSSRTDNRATVGKWLWLLPRAAFLLFVAGVGALLWLSHQTDLEEQKATLISDMLWLEQNVRFQLVRNEELLGQIGLEQADTFRVFESHARALLANSTGLRQILWIDDSGTMKHSSPSVTSGELVEDGRHAVPSQLYSQLTHATGRPTYSPARTIAKSNWQFEVYVPVFHEGTTAGVAVGVYSIQRIIEESVPWWLAERYRISVKDSSGTLLASRSKIDPTTSDAGYELVFDPPGHGLLLSATPYQTPLPIVKRLVAVALIFLAIAVLVSLWILRRHVLRRQAVEEELRQEHAFRKAMEDSLDTGMRARKLDGEIVYVNPAFCRMVGWSAAELIGCRPPMPYWADDYFDEIQAIHDSVLAGEGPGQGFELKLKHRNGDLIDVLIHEAPLIDANGNHFGWMGSMADITERKQADEHTSQQQERLQSTARLVAIGEMASSIAHELNQPLAAISSYCTGAANLLRNGVPAREIVPALDKAVEQAKRAGQIIRRIYSLARRSENRSDLIQLAESIDAALALIEVDIRRKGIRVKLDLQARPTIEGDPVLLEQALFNLFRNAADSMRDSSPDQRQIDITLAVAEGYAFLTITDHGCGIDASVANRLFEPLFTTKAEGLGMGLAICRSVVENHGGRLSFEPNPTGGTVFRITLP